MAANDIPKEYNPRKLAEGGAKLVLSDPKNRPTEAWILLRGADSDTYQDAFREQQRKRAQAMAKARKMVVPSPEELENDALELYAATTVAWGDLDQVGVAGELACTPKNAIELYRSRPDIREQVDLFINERANFLPSAAKDS